MTLTIDALRLTKTELMDALSPSPETIAAAQLVKVMNGVAEWLDEWDDGSEFGYSYASHFAYDIREAVKVAQSTAQ